MVALLLRVAAAVGSDRSGSLPTLDFGGVSTKSEGRMPRVTVSIPTVRSKTLRAAIESVQRQSWQDWELVVVGQGEDDSLRSVTEECGRTDQRVRYVHLSQKGISFARNAGIRVAQGDIIAFTDDDCEAEAGWLAHVVKCFDEDPSVGFVSGALVAPELRKHLLAVCPEIHPGDFTYDPLKDQAPVRFDFAGANFAIRKEVARKVGWFDECLGVGAVFASSEDLDYMLRVEAAGVRMRSTPASIVYHTHGARYGLKAVFRHRRSYAVGQGALAAKMTLNGDPRGKEWLDGVWADLLKTMKSGRLHRSPIAFLRYLYVRKSYVDCLQNHQIDTATGLYKHDKASSVT